MLLVGGLPSPPTILGHPKEVDIYSGALLSYEKLLYRPPLDAGVYILLLMSALLPVSKRRELSSPSGTPASISYDRLSSLFLDIPVSTLADLTIRLLSHDCSVARLLSFLL